MVLPFEVGFLSLPQAGTASQSGRRSPRVLDHEAWTTKHGPRSAASRLVTANVSCGSMAGKNCERIDDGQRQRDVAVARKALVDHCRTM
jgi:hypothetical protein